MALKKKTPELKEASQDFKKLSIFITIVDNGNGDAVISLFKNLGCSLQFVQTGQGTAQKEIRDIFGIEDNTKQVVFSLVRSEMLPQIKEEVEAFFIANKRNRGVGFAVPFNSIIGLKAYHFIANDL